VIRGGLRFRWRIDGRGRAGATALRVPCIAQGDSGGWTHFCTCLGYRLVRFLSRYIFGYFLACRSLFERIRITQRRGGRRERVRTATADGYRTGLKSLCENSFWPQLIERGISPATIYCGQNIKKVSHHSHSEDPPLQPESEYLGGDSARVGGVDDIGKAASSRRTPKKAVELGRARAGGGWGGRCDVIGFLFASRR
jgi:hypothetical protein